MWEYTYHNPKEGHNAAEYVAICKNGGYLLFLDSDTVGDMEGENMGFLKLSAEGARK